MTTVKLFDKNGLEIDHLTRWDYNVKLQIYDFPFDVAPICHFAKRLDKKCLVVTSTLSNGIVTVDIPNIFLTDENKTGQFTMFVFLTDIDGNTGRTIYQVDLPVAPKPKPDDYEYSDNVEVIELNVLRAKLESLIAQTEKTLDERIDTLENTYQATITEIQDSIRDDVDNLNRQITNSNTALIKQIQDNNSQLTLQIENATNELNSDIENATNNLNSEIESALNTMINGIRDGSPKSTFSNVEELSGKEAGIYLYINTESVDNGYIFYWDGEQLSQRLLYYAGIVVNDGEITFNKLADSLKKKIGIIVYYTLRAENWENQEQEIDIPNNIYNVTNETNATIHLDSDTYDFLSECDCESICIINNGNGDGKLVAQIEGNIPNEDFTIQLTLVDN